MNIQKLIPFCLLLLSVTASACFGQNYAVSDSEFVTALGKTKKTKNSRGVVAYDFSRSRHDLRLEDIVTNFSPETNGCSLSGSFTLTHLFYARFLGMKVKFKHADNIYATYAAKNGILEIKFFKEKGGNPLPFMVKAGALAVGASPKEAVAAGETVKKIEEWLFGESKQALASVLSVLEERLATLSQQKQLKKK
jgi:hypothetical protein